MTSRPSTFVIRASFVIEASTFVLHRVDLADSTHLTNLFLCCEFIAMSDVNVRCRQNGPFLVEGPVTITDHLGNKFPVPADKPAIALCRCGHSARRPFCDGAHNKHGFQADETAPTP